MAKILRQPGTIQEQRLKDFWTFVCERQNVYWRRARGDKPPWTEDPIVRNHFFCNVYRELDRGTQFAMNTVMNKYKTHEELLFRVIMYRLFNEPMTFELIEKHLRNYDGRKVGELLDRKHDAGIRIFRSAWMTSAGGLKGESKAYAYCRDMQLVYNNIKKIETKIAPLNSMEKVWKVIKEIKWIGPFAAYQIVLDLSYIWIFRSMWRDFDTWVYPGPGAKLGLLWLMGYSPAKKKGAGVRDKITYEECELRIKQLTKHQSRFFRKYGLEFVKWKGQRLNIHNIEYSLCEFNKYMRAQHGGKKRKFVPRED